MPPLGPLTVQPAGIVAGLGKPVKATPGGGLVEALPRPLHDHRHAAGSQRGVDQVQYSAEVSDVMQ
jgi:hypothetical protein